MILSLHFCIPAALDFSELPTARLSKYGWPNIVDFMFRLKNCVMQLITGIRFYLCQER